MKVVDLHPEDLIDKLPHGELTALERERLDSHLAQCSSCRFEISVRADLEQDCPLFEQRPQLTFAGQATQRGHTSENLQEVAEPGALRAGAPRSLRPRSRRHWPLVLLAASLILGAGGAMAAVVTGVVRAPAWLPWAPALNASEDVRKPGAKLAQKPKHALKGSVAVPVDAPPIATDALVIPVPSTEPAPAPKEVASPGLLRSALKHAVRRELDAAPSVPAAPAVAAFPAPPAADGSASQTPHADPAVAQPDPAASLFADANRARRDGNADRAVALYHSLQTRFPSSSESELSRALLAQLLLDRGSPEQALAGFDRYLSGAAPVLGAEAWVGRARALEQLGRSAQAVAAWQQVQNRFPGSVHAQLAATRLAALGMR